METRLNQMPDVLRVDEVATLLRISRGWAYELVRRGDIPSIRLGRRLLVPRKGLELWLDTCSCIESRIAD